MYVNIYVYVRNRVYIYGEMLKTKCIDICTNVKQNYRYMYKCTGLYIYMHLKFYLYATAPAVAGRVVYKLPGSP